MHYVYIIALNPTATYNENKQAGLPT